MEAIRLTGMTIAPSECHPHGQLIGTPNCCFKESSRTGERREELPNETWTSDGCGVLEDIPKLCVDPHLLPPGILPGIGVIKLVASVCKCSEALLFYTLWLERCPCNTWRVI